MVVFLPIAICVVFQGYKEFKGCLIEQQGQAASTLLSDRIQTAANTTHQAPDNNSISEEGSGRRGFTPFKGTGTKLG